ncbi:MAG: Cytidylate kinase [Candidatus Anoxychlamydiales bacterium]|nr:Cytidylate kinase [Candidatus Anoxychlamydiales bacterium]
MIITIDGPAGTGKSTIAKKLSEKLKFSYFDTGALYRSVTYALIKNKIDFEDTQKVSDFLKNDFIYEIKTINEKKYYFVNAEDVTQIIRSNYITENVSKVSSKKYVREKLLSKQRKYAEKNDVVCEGRDIGTVVFSNADVKIYLTAKASIRADRRFKQLIEKHPQDIGTLNKSQILEDIKKRDDQDSNRTISPLKKAKDAYLVDTSNLSIDQVVKKIIKIINKSKKMKFGYRFIKVLSKVILKVFYRFKVYGLENFTKKAAIITSNHVSYLDPPILTAAIKEELHFLARSSLFKVPFFKTILRNLNTHPISFNESNLQTFKTIDRILKRGKKIVIFPEGRRSEEGNISPLLNGVAFLVNLTKTDIIPVYIHGAFEVWGRNRKFPKLFGKISCVFGKSIKYEEFENLERNKKNEYILHRIDNSFNNLKKWCESGFTGPIP